MRFILLKQEFCNQLCQIERGENTIKSFGFDPRLWGYNTTLHYDDEIWCIMVGIWIQIVAANLQ